MISSPLPVRLGPEHLPALLAFEQAANDDAWSVPLLRAALADADYDVWALWETDKALCAVAIVAHLPFDAELQSICVLPSVRRRGVAARLLAWVLDQAERRGAERLLLELRESNTAARRLYERQGFTFDGQRRGYYRRADGGSEDAILMSRCLNEYLNDSLDT
ncbi:GNAT family N-acetyltransferase [Salinicola avicenniae]|uniref:GNAT family N-acetyltransferase n=1 Tax=Salinicola avicenniae TaxID=2916836 RepID=UPI00207407E5|nr:MULTISPECIES: GNAT family N-acetyltransferase [unclassified Salinicola]